MLTKQDLKRIEYIRHSSENTGKKINRIISNTIDFISSKILFLLFGTVVFVVHFLSSMSGEANIEE